MAGVNIRVQGFLDSWPIVSKQLEEAIRDGRERVVEFKRGLQAFENIQTDTLQTPEGEIPAASTPFEGDLEVQPD